jgi:hypothetical protein
VGVAEKYSRSINSSNLRSDEHHFDTDNLAAVALSSDLGNVLFRVKYGNDATTYNTLLMAWKDKVAKKADLRKWPRHITARKVAEISLSYWLNDVCEVCEGRGYETLPNSPVLSDDVCKCCKGEKKKPLVCEANWRDYILDMLEDLEEMARYSAGEAMKKLARDMDF